MTAKAKTKLSSEGEAAIRRIEQLSKQMRKPGQVAVGLPSGSNDYPDGTSVIMVGSVHEFGSPKMGIPQRSYLRSTVVSNKREYKRLFQKLAKRIVSGKDTSEVAMRKLGLQVTTDVKDKITDLKRPPLKHRDGNPLVDTGMLRRAITWQILD